MTNKCVHEILVVTADAELGDQLVARVLDILPLIAPRWASAVSVAQLILQGPDPIDLVMMEMDSHNLGLFRWMRAQDRFKSAPIIVFGKAGTGGTAGLLLDFGPTSFLGIPFTPESLRQALETALPQV